MSDVAEAYLRDNAVAALQLGSGLHLLPGWLNSDYPAAPEDGVALDATAPFPLPDAAFDYILAEHMIEHLPYPGALAMLGECLRVLKPGGVLRVSTPDIGFLVRLLREDLSPLERDYIAWAADVIEGGEPVTALGVVNNFVRAWGHRFIFDKPTLAGAIAGAGFVDIVEARVGVSAHAALDGIDHDGRMPRRFLELETMVIEAKRP